MESFAGGKQEDFSLLYWYKSPIARLQAVGEHGVGKAEGEGNDICRTT